MFKICMYMYSSCAPIFPQNICIVISFFSLSAFFYIFLFFIFFSFHLLFFVAVGLPVYLNITVEGL